jgi:hypothetical protein
MLIAKRPEAAAHSFFFFSRPAIAPPPHKIPPQYTRVVPVDTIDNRCKDSRFLLPASFLTISNPGLHSSLGSGVNPEIRSRKSPDLNQLNVKRHW